MSALFTDEQRFLLLANGRESLQNSDFDPAPVVKLFTPDAGATWLLTEIDPDDHDRWVEAVFAAPWPHDTAHPMYLYLAGHCGMGLPLDELWALLGTRLEDGVMFGHGALHFDRALRIGAPHFFGCYEVVINPDNIDLRQVDKFKTLGIGDATSHNKV